MRVELVETCTVCGGSGSTILNVKCHSCNGWGIIRSERDILEIIISDDSFVTLKTKKDYHIYDTNMIKDSGITDFTEKLN